MKFKKGSSMLSSIFLGVSGALVTMLALCCAAATLIMGEKIGEQSYLWVGLAITGISVLVGCIISTSVYKQKILPTVASVFAGYTLVMILTGFIFFGNITNIGFYNLPVGIIGALAVCVLHLGKGKRRYR